MKKLAGLIDIYKMLPGLTNGVFVYKDDDTRLVFDSIYIDFDNLTIELRSGPKRFRTQAVKEIIIEDDTLHKTFFMKSFYNKCFEIKYIYNINS